MKNILLTILLILGATAVSADDHLPTAGEILQNGKVLHKEIHLKRDFKYLNNKPDMTLNQYTTDVDLLVYHVLYQHDYFTCWVRAEEHTSAYSYVGCYRLNEGITDENEPENTSELGEVEELIEKKLQQAMNSSEDLEIKDDAEDPFVTSYYTFPDNFTTNLKGSKVFLQFNIGVSTQYDKIVMENVEKHQLALRSEILGVVSEFPSAELRGMDGPRDLAYRIRKSINNRLEILEGFGGVEEVFFTSFNIK